MAPDWLVPASILLLLCFSADRLSIRRDGARLACHGFTELRRGDLVTVMGSRESLEQVKRKSAV